MVFLVGHEQSPVKLNKLKQKLLFVFTAKSIKSKIRCLLVRVLGAFQKIY